MRAGSNLPYGGRHDLFSLASRAAVGNISRRTGERLFVFWFRVTRSGRVDGGMMTGSRLAISILAKAKRQAKRPDDGATVGRLAMATTFFLDS